MKRESRERTSKGISDNGDGARVKKTYNGVTTYYVGALYEYTTWNGGYSISKFYYFRSQRVAMKQDINISYLHTDHLGSTNKTTGASASTQTYYPYGATKSSSGTVPTDYGFTGQKRDATANLMFYGARYYDPALARFVQPDTIVPNPLDPQSLNRYSYVRNNPVNFIDPTGHEDCAPEDDWCWQNRWYEAHGYCWSDRKQDWSKQCTPVFQDEKIREEVFQEQVRYILTQAYGYIDTAHFYDGFRLANDIFRQILLQTFTSEGDYHIYLNVMFERTIGPLVARIGYASNYIATRAAVDENLIGVALGIFMDFEIGFENWQGHVDFAGSSFAMEDLPSDYLGFYSAAKGASLSTIVGLLGGGTGSADGPPHCVNIAPGCTYKNYQFTPMVQTASGAYQNIAWPDALAITPVLSNGTNWYRAGGDPLGYINVGAP